MNDICQLARNPGRTVDNPLPVPSSAAALVALSTTKEVWQFLASISTMPRQTSVCDASGSRAQHVGHTTPSHRWRQLMHSRVCRLTRVPVFSDTQGHWGYEFLQRAVSRCQARSATGTVPYNTVDLPWMLPGTVTMLRQPASRKLTPLPRLDTGLHSGLSASASDSIRTQTKCAKSQNHC